MAVDERKEGIRDTPNLDKLRFIEHRDKYIYKCLYCNTLFDSDNIPFSCPKCGSICPNCGKIMVDDTTKCIKCGWIRKYR